jgi:hypothetical protein
MTSHQSPLTVRREGVARRCDICHQSDRFDAATGICQRCLPAIELAPKGGYGLDAIRSLNVPERFRETLLREVGDERVLWVGTPSGTFLLGQRKELWIRLFFVVAMFVVSQWVIQWVIGSDKSDGHFLPVDWLVRTLPWMIPVLIVFKSVFSLRTLYCITENRILILEVEHHLKKVTTFGAMSRLFLERTERRDGSGNLIFDKQAGEINAKGFYGVERVAEVERIIRENILKSAKIQDER